MSSFFYTKNKYILSFNSEDLMEKSIDPILKECNLKENMQVIMNLKEAKDIKIYNLISLLEFILLAKKNYSKIKFNLSEDLMDLLKKANLLIYFIEK